LRELEQRFPREVAVVGVHSGKYIAERDTARIREAAARLGNTHPIVNDRQFRVWRSYAVNAWPTLVVVDPEGYVVATRPGEFTARAVGAALERMIEAYDERALLDRAPLEFPHDPPAVAPGALRYPGKVAVSGSRIAIADSGHHRVLVGRLAELPERDGASARRMRVELVVGGEGPGFADAERPGEARFTTPQGLLFAESPAGSPAGDTLYVADAGSHAVRAISLGGERPGAVRTVAGTGRQLRTQADLDAGALSSPWDVARVGDTLYVAMAGIHQLWALDLATGALRPHAGQFGEDIADAPLRQALLAQPMGIARDAAGERLYFVDAESSAVRWADVDPAGAVRTLVGTGLFDFGDEDGAGDAVRMQHEQGLAVHPDGRLLVADSYNDALKWVDPATRRAETWLRGFHEPGGVALAAGVVYVADTNAHRIAVVDERTGEVGELELEFGSDA
jgi:sugar lactone lactonase YvrE